ncbi:hypothetical protein [Adhaeribacter pallidiroseus]|uniref:Uncharacterized protein n=1 Tax=Adhaeribacter pallidiroseus TaxID=2072847 RepID=A0A369QES4_9BACT|nr:hypothetical protein [Adhaeribacter pallidiroseus]RDC63214.1 hypothetical protein AHMF7616_01815 [Adhaeribacter pallidiroseus]
MATNTNSLPKHQSARINWLAKEVIAWVLVIGIFATLLTYWYIWSSVVLSNLQIAGLWITGGLLTFTPFIQKYLQALNLRFEQDLILRFAFIVPAFISILLLLNYFLPVAIYQETHSITGTYDIVIYKKRMELSYVGLILKNDAYAGVEKIRTIDPRNVPDYPQQITYTFNQGIVGIKTLKEYAIK